MIIILTGPVHSGKTTLLAGAASGIQASGREVEGYLTPSLWKEHTVEGYDLLDIRSGGRLPFLRRSGRASWQRVGPFYLDPEALDRAGRIIRSAAPRLPLVVDEVGPLELAGGGVRRALGEALEARSGPTLLVVRRPILEEILDVFGIASARIVDVGESDAAATLHVWMKYLH